MKNHREDGTGSKHRLEIVLAVDFWTRRLKMFKIQDEHCTRNREGFDLEVVSTGLSLRLGFESGQRIYLNLGSEAELER